MKKKKLQRSCLCRNSLVLLQFREGRLREVTRREGGVVSVILRFLVETGLLGTAV